MFFKRSKRTSNDNVPEAPEAETAAVSIIGPDVTIDGNIMTDGEIRIDGTVRGTVQAAVCVVGLDGLVEGTILADEVVVRGVVKGPIRGQHVELQAGAHVEGDVVNASIAVENGAHIHGSIWHADDPLNARSEADARSERATATLLNSPLWGTTNDGYRPVKVIKPR